jgi:hypothetical protein
VPALLALSARAQPDAPRTGAVQRGRAGGNAGGAARPAAPPPRPPRANIRGIDHSAAAMNCGPGGGGG